MAVFGSAVRDDFRPDSDVDFLVTFSPSAQVGMIRFIDLKDKLSELVGRPVDLVSKRGLHPVIRNNVLSEAETIYAI